MNKQINTVSNTSIYIENEYIDDLWKLLKKFNQQKTLVNNIWNIPTGAIGQINLNKLQININPNVCYLNNYDYLRLINQTGPDEKEEGYLGLDKGLTTEELILGSFHNNLIKLAKNGFPRTYNHLNTTSNYFKGLVDVPKSYQSYLLKEKEFVHTKTDNLEINNFYAIVIKAAYEKICLINKKYKKPFITSSLSVIKKQIFKRVNSDHYIQAKHQYNKQFLETFELACIIINDLNSLKADGNYSTSLLLNSNIIFEDFISDFLIKKFPRERFSLQQQNVSATYNEKEIISKPDILYLGPKKVIIDVKNKNFDKAITSENYHQMISYMNSFDIQTAILIYPYNRESDEKLFTIKSDDNLKLYALSIDIKSRNFEPFVTQLSSILQYG